MKKGVFVFTIICFFVSSLTGCSKGDDTLKEDTAVSGRNKNLLIYCGITMVHPMKKIADIIEEKYNCEITMLQGGSEDLYQSLKMSNKGDLYLPGSDSYRERHFSEGLLADYIFVGYNQAALVVAKGNPKNIPSDIHIFANQNYAVSIGNAESSSVGRQAKKILSRIGIYEQVLENAVQVSSDSRTMNNLLKEGAVDVILNWRATAYFDENKDKLGEIRLDRSIAPKNKLLINLTTCSQHPGIARAFMQYAGSEQGQKIFQQYGFLDTVGAARTIQQ